MLLTFRVGGLLPAPGVGGGQVGWVRLVLRGLVGFGGHHQLLSGQTGCGRSTTMLQRFIKLHG